MSYSSSRKQRESARELSSRTQAAIRNKGLGNCLAHAEAVNGILRACGLDFYAIGQWYQYHASNGLVIGASTFHIDAWSYRRSRLNTGTLPEVAYDAWLDAARYDTTTVVHQGPTTEEYTATEVDNSLLHEVFIDDTWNTRVVLPGNSAVLMYAAMVATDPHRNDSSKARNVLEPYAPTTVVE